MGYVVGALALALVAGLQPTTLLRSVAFLDHPPPGRTLAWRFAAGLAATLLGVAVVAGVGASIVIRGSTVPTSRIDSSDVVLGGVALVAALVGLASNPRHRPAPDQLPDLPAASLAGPVAGFGLGVRTMATSIAPLALYIAAVGEIVSIAGLWGLASVLLVVVTAMVLGAGLIPPSLEAATPDRAARMLPRLIEWALTAGPRTAAVLTGIAGAALVVRGILD